ncbi:MAG: ABC transporter permease, partial [Bacteroidales bacterium]
MYRNYLISTLRSFNNNKAFSIIYLVGLAIGITSCLIIFLFVENELKFDRIHPDYGRTYRVVHLFKMPHSDDFTANTQVPMADAIRETMTGVERVVQLYHLDEQKVILGNEVFMANNFVYTESEFFDFFECEWISGDPVSALRDMNSIILTEGLASKYFNPDSVLGQSLILFDTIRFTITGLVKDPDIHTHLPFTALISFNSLKEEMFGFNYDQWRATLSGFFTYVKLNPGITANGFEKQFEVLKEKYVREDDREMEYFFLQPLTDIHLNKMFRMDNPGYTTSREFIIIISLVGFLILIIASINVINLRTVHAMRRSVEVGIRKVSGAFRKDLIRQFMFENLILVVLAVIISLLLSEVLLNSVNRIFDGTLNLDLYASYLLFLFLVFVIIIVTTLNGIYPSVILSSFN